MWWALRGAGSSLGVGVNATFLARELPARGIFVDKAPAGLRKPCSLIRSTVDMVSPRKKPHRLYFAALRKEKKAEMLLFVHTQTSCRIIVDGLDICFDTCLLFVCDAQAICDLRADTLATVLDAAVSLPVDSSLSVMLDQNVQRGVRRSVPAPLPAAEGEGRAGGGEGTPQKPTIQESVACHKPSEFRMTSLNGKVGNSPFYCSSCVSARGFVLTWTRAHLLREDR